MKITIKESKSVINKIIVYIFNGNVIKHLFTRNKLPYNTYKKEVLPDVIKELKEKSKIELKPNDFHWNKRAGCCCGCSPGFIAKVPQIHYGYEIHVTV